jgi:hypothetical protein
MPSVGKHEQKRREPARRLPALLAALLFFFGPLGAFLLGARAESFENRALAELPSPSDGWSFFPDFTTWAVDHLPLRQQAVEAYAAGSEGVFGEPPSYGSTDQGPLGGVEDGESTDAEVTDYPQVIQGEDGWLYLGADVSNMCDPTRSIDETLDRLDRLAEAVEASGRRFVLTIAPDKSTIYPDNLPDTFLGENCAAERRDAFWEALRAERPDWYVDLRGPLEDEQEHSGEPIYRPTDTHWAPRGTVVYAYELARALDPRLLAGFDVVENGEARRVGDLGTLLGTPTEDEYPDVAVRRDGVVPVGRESLRLPELAYDAPLTITNRTTGVPLFAPRTLLLGDSFTNSSRDALGGLFAELALLHNEVAAEDPQIPADAMAGADVIVYEIVERSLGSGRAALLEDDALAAIEAALAAAPR